MKKIRLFLAAFAAMVSLGVNAQTWSGSDPAEGIFFLYNVGTGKFINVGDKTAGWGTNAYLTAEYGLDFTFEANDAAYNLNTQVSNGGSNYYLSTGLWCDGAATPWTFTKVDREDINAYTISNGGSYIVANEAGTDITYAALSDTERDQWQLIGSSDILANLQASTAAGVKRTVATFFISDPDFGRNDMRRPNWPYTVEGGNSTVPGFGVGQGNNPNYGCEFWNNTFDIHQDLTDLPNGIYEFEIYGYGTNNTTYVYATTTEGTTSKVFKNQTSAANFQTALNNIDNYGGNVTGLVQVKDGKLTIGVKRETNSSADWTVIDQARLYYYGDYTFAEAYGADLKALITTAQGLVDAAPDFLYTAKSALQSAIADAQEVMKSGTTESEFAIATQALQSAVDTYNTKLALVSRYTAVRTAALAINPSLDVTAADAKAAAATTADEVTSAVITVRYDFVSAIGEVEIPEVGYIDVTAVMVDNASVSENTNYWTAVENGSEKTSGSWAVCNYGECEFYNNNFKFYQTLGLNVGTWEFGVTGFHRAGNHSTYFYAGEDKILIPGVESSVVNSMAQAKDYFDAGNGQVSLKFIVEENSNIEIGIDNTDTQTDKWTIFRNFTLKYYGAPDYSVYIEQWNEAVEDAEAAKMNYPNVTGTELTALDNAIADEPDGSSKANYLEKIQALQKATNTFTAAAPNYDNYVAYRAETVALFGEEVASIVTEPTSAAEAATAVQDLNIAQYNKVADEYKYSLNGLIGDFGSWTATATVAGEPGTANYLTNEHWSGIEHAYYEQDVNGWGNANGWTIKYEKTCKLAAGNYVLKVAARSSAGTTSRVSCTATETEISLPNVGAASRGITDNGVASWDDSYTYANNNTGYGWQWRFLTFTLDEETEVTMTFYAEASTQYQWMSIADAELLSDEDKSVSVSYDENEDNTIEDVAVANVTITREIILDYNNVVLPFTLTANQVAEAFGAGTVVYNYTETKISDTESEINFNKGDGSITANVPVLIKATAESNEQYFEGVQIVAAESAEVEGFNFNYTGCYKPAALSIGDYYYDSFYQSYYGGPKMSQGTEDIYANAFYAYFKDVNPEAGTKTVTVKIDGIATGIATIENGKMNIEEGAIYNAAGQRLNKLQKGLNIVNGKKFIVK